MSKNTIIVLIHHCNKLLYLTLYILVFIHNLTNETFEF
jgi:hypothetical protein